MENPEYHKTGLTRHDATGHHGLDGHYYLLDLARLMPPENPSRYYYIPISLLVLEHL